MPAIIKKISDTKKDRSSLRQTIGWQMQVSSKVWSPPTDMYEMDNAYVVRVEIAGMRDADFTVSVEEGILLISGNRADIQERRAFHQMEIRCGNFASAVSLPNLVDVESVSAEYEDGFFVVTLPKLVSKKK